MGRTGERPKNARKTFFRLMSYLGGFKVSLAVIFVLVIVTISSGLIGSYMIRPIINDYIIPGDITGLGRILLVLAAVYLAGVLSAFVQYRMQNKMGQRVTARIRSQLFEKTERLPVRYFDTHQHGDLMSRYTNDMDRVSEMLTDSLVDFFSAVLSVTGILVMMLYISPLLTLVTLVTLPLMFLAANFIARRSKKYFRAQQGSLGDLNGYVEEMISGGKVVKVFSHEKKVNEGFEKLNAELNDKSEKAQLYSGMMMPAMQNLSTLNFVIVTIAGALMSIYRGFDVGGIAVFLQYSRQFARPINEIATLYNNIQAAIAGAERIFQLIDEEPERPDAKDAADLDPAVVEGDIRMTNVTFAYVEGNLVLKNISLHVKPGEKIGLVGATGAGKTSIFNLLPRFYDIQSGSIEIDGTDIRDIKRDSLRGMFAMVLQDTHLFSGTIADNIRFGKPGATDEEVIAAAELTSAHSFIKRLPYGYNTTVEDDGANLSQGQRQLINITRAAVSDPVILLLDEATSNIDSRSEMLIQHGLDKLMDGRTSIVIAHRLFTVRHMDKILVLDDGKIVEQGTHSELMDRKGHYYRLYMTQFRD